MPPFYVPMMKTDIPVTYGSHGFFPSSAYGSVPEVFATSIPESGRPKYDPDSAAVQRDGCAVCKEKNEMMQTNSGTILPLEDYSSSPSPWTKESDKMSMPTNRLTGRKLCHIKERKELLIRVYLILLVDLLLCYLFCVVFHIIMFEELNVIKDEKPWIKWTPLIIYLSCCAIFVCFPAQVLKHRLCSYAMIIAIVGKLGGWPDCGSEN
ncbi:hypothetical protein Btru_054110 [Bulinus truncatus]|nr:hypothetical protein Btru_054110 [Bulinus truncatus]